MTLSIYTLNMLHVQDNYNFILHDSDSGMVAVVDPSEEHGVSAFLETRGWGLDLIFNTHHHWDHVSGNLPLKRRYGAKIVGNAADADRIPGIDVQVRAGEHFLFGHHAAEILDIPGHTVGHIAYYFAKDKALFSGDTIFAMGCGRMFEGTAEQFHASIEKIKALPDDVRIYAAHEYTIPNGRFAKQIEPGNIAIAEQIEWARGRRRDGQPTIPTTIALEKATNPFFHVQSPKAFATIRAAKDRFS